MSEIRCPVFRNKKRFSRRNRHAIRIHIQSLQRKNRENYTIYQCPHCDGNHITSMSREDNNLVARKKLFSIIKHEGNRFFSVYFIRKTDSKNGKKGQLRKMLCRTGVNNYKKGIIPDEVRDKEDLDHGVLTVWSVDSYQSNIKNGMDKTLAASNAWRRINLDEIVSCSIEKVEEEILNG